MLELWVKLLVKYYQIIYVSWYEHGSPWDFAYNRGTRNPFVPLLFSVSTTCDFVSGIHDIIDVC